MSGLEFGFADGYEPEPKQSNGDIGDIIIKLLTEIRDRLTPAMPAPADPVVAGLLKAAGLDLQTSAVALEQAAAQLRDDGKGYHARLAKVAAMRARQAAEWILA